MRLAFRCSVESAHFVSFRVFELELVLSYPVDRGLFHFPKLPCGSCSRLRGYLSPHRLLHEADVAPIYFRLLLPLALALRVEDFLRRLRRKLID